MSKFVTGKELENVVYDILFEAKSKLLLLSPYIKLDDYFRNQLLARHARNPELELIVVFGKNEGNITRSVSRADIDYFMGFMNVTIIYAPNLHAKYYGNEVKGVATSINLYDYSFRNNIEFGIYSENDPIMERFLEAMHKKSPEDQSFEQAMLAASSHDVIYAKRPIYKQRGGLMSKLVGSALAKDYLGTEVVFDAVDALLHNRPYEAKRLPNFPKEIEFRQMVPQVRPTRQEVESTPIAQPSAPTSAPPLKAPESVQQTASTWNQLMKEMRPIVQEQASIQSPSAVSSLSANQIPTPANSVAAPHPKTAVTPVQRFNRAQPSVTSLGTQPAKTTWKPRPQATEQGYCIRTGTPIPFNQERPFSYPAFKSWAKFSNDDYPERYCHKTGQLSNGKTSKRNPVLVTA